MKPKSKLGDRYEKTTNPTIGHKYHLAWADHKCVWILKEISSGGKFCKLETLKTRKMIVAKVEDLRLLSKENPRNTYKPN